jgi:hypothetical protein
MSKPTYDARFDFSAHGQIAAQSFEHVTSAPNAIDWAFFDPLSSSKAPQVFMTFDFETQSADDWFAVGVVVAEYPSGKIIHQWKTGVPIPWKEFDTKNKTFWKRLASIKAELDAQNTNEYTLEQKQKQVCEFIRLMHFMYPRLRPVSDNPGLDCGLLNSMLAAHQMPAITMRENGSSAPVLCTYSYALCVLGTTGGQTRDSVESMHSQIFAPFKKHVYREVDELAMGSKHIPINDCARTLSMHFKVLDIVRFYRLYALRPTRMLHPDFFGQFNLVPQMVQYCQPTTHKGVDNCAEDADDGSTQKPLAMVNSSPPPKIL